MPSPVLLCCQHGLFRKVQSLNQKVTSSLNPLRGAVSRRKHVDDGEIAAVVRNPAGRLQLRAPDRADAEILCEYDEGKLVPFSCTAVQVLSAKTVNIMIRWVFANVPTSGLKKPSINHMHAG